MNHQVSAGEQGRGFAVVASEVRGLAQRSSAAAKEIMALIANSVTQSDADTRLVSEAGMTMAAIIDSVRSVTDIMGEISVASAEQSAGIGEINMAVVQMDQVTQENAALVEEAAAASMQDQALSLAQPGTPGSGLTFRHPGVRSDIRTFLHGTPGSGLTFGHFCRVRSDIRTFFQCTAPRGQV